MHAPVNCFKYVQLTDDNPGQCCMHRSFCCDSILIFHLNADVCLIATVHEAAASSVFEVHATHLLTVVIIMGNKMPIQCPFPKENQFCNLLVER